MKLDCLSEIKNYKNYKAYVHTYSKFLSLVYAQEKGCGASVEGIEKKIGDWNSKKNCLQLCMDMCFYTSGVKLPQCI